MQKLLTSFLAATIWMSCQNQPAPTPTAPAATAILKHTYWVSKPFHDALFAPNVPDTLASLMCGELIFSKDSVIFTSCMSDAGRGTLKSTGTNTMEIIFEGFEGKPSKAQLDEATGVLHLTPPSDQDYGWPTEFVAQDDVATSNLDNVTLNLGRKRLAGTYMALPGKGSAGGSLELRADGTQSGLGDFDLYEPWLAGIGGGAIQNPQRNLLYLVKKGKEADGTAFGWQLRGDTLRIWETKATNAEGDMPEYQPTTLKGTYLKTK